MASEFALDITKLTEESVNECGVALRKLAEGVSHRRRAAENIVSFLYDHVREPESGERSCALVRCFQTSAYAQMPLHYQEAADRLLESMPSQPDMRCLALLSTRGHKRTWNDVMTSTGHQAIPLPSAEVVSRAPMIARLLNDLGVSAAQVVAPPDSPDFLVGEVLRERNVFHVPDALGSPFIPAQEAFVKPFGVRSVIGMGGLLPDGSLFAILLFTRTLVSRESAKRLQKLATHISAALAPFSPNKIYASR